MVILCMHHFYLIKDPPFILALIWLFLYMLVGVHETVNQSIAVPPIPLFKLISIAIMVKHYQTWKDTQQNVSLRLSSEWAFWPSNLQGKSKVIRNGLKCISKRRNNKHYNLSQCYCSQKVDFKHVHADNLQYLHVQWWTGTSSGILVHGPVCMHARFVFWSHRASSILQCSG